MSGAEKDYVKEDLLHKSYVYKEADNEKAWKFNWGWILDEYEDYLKKSKQISEKSTFIAHVTGQTKEKDQRKITPIPETTNHEYGWLSTKQEFRLNTYGPDVDKMLPLPEKYHLQNTK